jgi:hypothetical protein
MPGNLPHEISYFLPSPHDSVSRYPTQISFSLSLSNSISQQTVSRLSRQCGILNISQHYRPPRPVTGIALLYGDGVCFL